VVSYYFTVFHEVIINSTITTTYTFILSQVIPFNYTATHAFNFPPTSPQRPPESKTSVHGPLWIRKLKPDPLKRVEFSDTEVGGIRGQLVLRVSPAGRKSFSYQYFSVGVTRNRRITLGEYPAVRLKKARDQARELAGEIASGRDPAAERAEEKAKTQQERSEVRTFDDVAELYLRDYAERQKRPKSVAEDRRILQHDLVPTFKGRDINTIRILGRMSCAYWIPSSPGAAPRWPTE